MKREKFSLVRRSDTADLTATFAQQGAVSISNLVPEGQAHALRRELEGSANWLEIFRAGEQVYEMPQAAFRELKEDRKQALSRMVLDAARLGLQYRYRAIRVAEDAEDRLARGLLLDRFVSFLNSAPVRAELRRITGCNDIDFADGQATDFSAGDFLTSHDDAVEGKGRVAAYVFGLTPVWQADWGGLLLLERNHSVAGFVPAFNEMRLFRVPARHHVSYVAPWVGERRLSVTGWLRSRRAHSGS